MNNIMHNFFFFCFFLFFPAFEVRIYYIIYSVYDDACDYLLMDGLVGGAYLSLSFLIVLICYENVSG